MYTDHKNLTWKNFNTNRVLRWRLISEEYGPDIEHIPYKKNIAADTISWLPNNGNQETTHESMYLTETMSELYVIEELSEDNFLLSFKIIDRYHQEYPTLAEKLILQNI